jgi:hypothetical protein
MKLFAEYVGTRVAVYGYDSTGLYSNGARGSLALTMDSCARVKLDSGYTVSVAWHQCVRLKKIKREPRTVWILKSFVEERFRSKGGLDVIPFAPDPSVEARWVKFTEVKK